MLVLDNSTFTVLTTERLVLRKLSLEDVDAVFALRSDPEAMRYVPRPLAKDRDEAVAIAGRVPGARIGTVEVRQVREITGLP